jgi:hypothetical protein
VGGRQDLIRFEEVSKMALWSKWTRVQKILVSCIWAFVIVAGALVAAVSPRPRPSPDPKLAAMLAQAGRSTSEAAAERPNSYVTVSGKIACLSVEMMVPVARSIMDGEADVARYLLNGTNGCVLMEGGLDAVPLERDSTGGFLKVRIRLRTDSLVTVWTVLAGVRRVGS